MASVIHDVDSALRALIVRDAAGTRDVEVVFDAPTREWAGRRNAPTIDVYLYDIREDMRRRERGLLNEYDEDQHVIARHLPPRHFKLSYMITAWTQRPEDEHRLLSSLLNCFLRFDALPAELITGPLADLGLPVPVTIALPPPEDRAFADVWSALGGELKPSIDVVVSAPVDTGQRYETGPLTTAPPSVSLGGSEGWPPRERAGGSRAGAFARRGRRRQRPGRDAAAPAYGQESPMTRADLEHLLGRARLIEDRVRELVQHRRVDDPAPDDPFRGLYVSDEAVEAILDRPAAAALGPLAGPMRSEIERAADVAEAAGEQLRLRRLTRDAALGRLDEELLVIALLPDLDARFERLYGYLNDDVTRRRASVGLALELAGESSMSAPARGRLEPSGPLVRLGLLIVEDTERPFLSRGLRVPDRVVAHLLGDDAPDPALVGLVDNVAPYDVPLTRQIRQALVSGVRLAHLRERVSGTGAAVAVAALRLAGRDALVLDLNRLGGSHDAVAVARIAVREVLLRGAGLVAGPVEVLADGRARGRTPARRRARPGVPGRLSHLGSAVGGRVSPAAGRSRAGRPGPVGVVGT